MWQNGFHCSKNFKDTNKRLSEIEGEISTKEAQIAFAQYCCANPSFAAKLLMGIDLYPIQDMLIRSFFERDYVLSVASRGYSKTTVAGVFLPLYAIFNPKVTIGITGPSFRQSRNIFEKIEDTIRTRDGMFLKQCLRGEPKHNSDAWEMNFTNGSKIIALPLGCIGGESFVKTDFGFLKIKDIYEKSADGASIWGRVGFNVDSYEKPETRCANVMHAGKKKLLSIKLNNGIEIKCSQDHKFLVSKGRDSGATWIEAKDFKPNYRICVDVRNNFPSQKLGNLTFSTGQKDGRARAFSYSEDYSFVCNGDEYLRGFLYGLLESLAKTEIHLGRGVFCSEMPTEDLAKIVQYSLLMFSVNSKREGAKIIIKGAEIDYYIKNICYLEKTKCRGLKSKFQYIKKRYFIYEKIESIELGEDEEDSYDLRVPAFCNYNVNGVISHNSGGKIRGYRFNLLVIDELLMLSEKIINEVLIPFMAVQIDPKKRQEIREAEDKLIKAGKLSEINRTLFPNNKLIGLTSASYQFEYLYKMFSDYKEMIFDPKAEGVSHALMQLSYLSAPPGLFDENTIANAKKTSSRAQFDREYMACFTGDSSGFYSAKKLHEASLELGDSPTIKIKGSEGKDYILAMDPNYDSSETSDHFAMCLGELDYESEIAYMVHGYAVASCTIKERMAYIKYLFENFNIVYMIVDKAGGEKFIKDINDLGVLDFKLEFFDADFETFSDEEIYDAKSSYRDGGRVRKIVHSQYFSPNWIRYANETLQGAVENKKIIFAAPIDADKLNKSEIDIENILFDEKTKYGTKPEELKLKMNDFVDHQKTMIAQTKQQCSLIEVSSSGATMRFDLPSSLRNQTGPDKARKDSYSVLLLMNWAKYCWFSMRKVTIKKRKSFIPSFLA